MAAFVRKLLLIPQATADHDDQSLRDISNSPEVNVPPLDRCLVCDKTAEIECEDCANAPSLANTKGLNSVAVYCGEACRKQHWKIHKPICKVLRQRIQLARAAQFLVRVWYTYKRHAFETNVVAIRQHPPKILLVSEELRERQGKCFIQPLPDAIAQAAPDILHATLTFRASDEATTWLAPLLADLMGDQTESLDALECRPINQRLLPVICMGNDEISNNNGTHRVLMVKLKSGESWVVDPTAAQFGWDEPVMSWNAWRGHRAISPSITNRYSIETFVYQELEHPLSPHQDLFNWYQQWELRDAGCLLFRGLLPSVLKSKELGTQGIALKDMVRNRKHDSILEKVHAVLQNTFPACVRAYFEQHCLRRRFEITKAYMEHGGVSPDSLFKMRILERNEYKEYQLTLSKSCCTSDLWNRFGTDTTELAGSVLAETFGSTFEINLEST